MLKFLGISIPVTFLASFLIALLAACGTPAVDGMVVTPVPIAPTYPPKDVVLAPPPAELNVFLSGFTNGESADDMSLFGDIVVQANMDLQPITNDVNPYQGLVEVYCAGDRVFPVGWGINLLTGKQLVLGFGQHKRSNSVCVVKVLAGFQAMNGKRLAADTTLTFRTRTLGEQFDRLGHKLGDPNRPRWWMVTRNNVSVDCNGFDVAREVDRTIFIVCSGGGKVYTVDENNSDVGSLNLFLGHAGDETYIFTTGDEYTIE